MNTLYIYGVHPTSEALRARPECVIKVLMNSGDYPEFETLAKKNDIRIGDFVFKELKKHIGEHAVHQNVVAVIDADKLTTSLPEFLETLDVNTNPALALLGEIQDPQNVGAIIRSAAAFGISGVLIPKDRQAQVTGSVIKASAGMAFRVPLVAIGNVNQTVRELKSRDFWIYGLAGEGEKRLSDESFDAPTVFVVGNEGKGVREKTGEHCDALLSIPMNPRAESLNAAASATVAFYEWSRGKALE